jgi:hypothetical protein
MNPISPFAQHILRFSGVHNQVLEELESQREKLRQDSKNLFGEQMDLFVKREDPLANTGTVELITGQQDSKAIPYSSGIIRALNRFITGQDIKPATEILTRTPEHSGDLFERSIQGRN